MEIANKSISDKWSLLLAKVTYFATFYSKASFSHA